jgi:hypothetical protein
MKKHSQRNNPKLLGLLIRLRSYLKEARSKREYILNRFKNFIQKRSKPRKKPTPSGEFTLEISVNKESTQIKSRDFFQSEKGVSVATFKNLQLIRTESFNKVHLFIINAFEDVGVISDIKIVVSNNGKIIKTHNNGTLFPGQAWIMDINPEAKYFYNNLSKYLVPSGPSPEETSKFIKSWISKPIEKRINFRKIKSGPVYIYGPSDANFPGGEGIYPNLYWAHSQDGVSAAADILLGWANRMMIFKISPKVTNFITPWTSGDLFKGHDSSRAIETEGFTKVKKDSPKNQPRIDGSYKMLDHQHLGRISHPAYFLAKQGYKFAEIILEFIANDVSLRWTTANTKGGSPNYAWWTCYNLLESYPKKKGCEITGRAYGQAMMALAYAIDILPKKRSEQYYKNLSLMVDTAHSVFDYDNKALLKLKHIDPVFNTESYEWEKKFRTLEHSIPIGQHPDIQPQFEEGILFWGLELTKLVFNRRALVESSEASIEKMQQDIQDSFMTHNATLRVMPNSKFFQSSKSPSTWSGLVIGSLAVEGVIYNTLKQYPFSNPFTSYRYNVSEIKYML